VSRAITVLLRELRRGEDLWFSALEALPRLDDPGLLALADLAAAWSLDAILHQRMRARLDTAMAVLARRFPEGAPRLDEGDEALASEIERLLAPRPAAARTAAEEEALLAAIYARPDDDAPRLVYADWLLERGDERGEFIQLELSERSPEAEARHAELEAVAQLRWRGPLAEVLLEVRFRRGFVADVQVAWDNPGQLQRLGAHPAWATIEELDYTWGPRAPGIAGGRQHLDPSMRSLRSLSGVSDAGLLNLCAAGVPWAIEMIQARVADADAGRAMSATELLPKLTRLHLWCDAPMTWLWHARWAHQLEELTLATRRSLWTVRREASRLRGLVELEVLLGEAAFTLRRGPQHDFSILETRVPARELVPVLERAPPDALTELVYARSVEPAWRARLDAALASQRRLT
jgi:uncharacterized protein (TIGR02996 family)